MEALAGTSFEYEQNHLWIEKVSYSSRLLTGSYKIAAIKAASCPGRRIGAQLWQNIATSVQNGRPYVKILKQTPLFSDIPEWQLEASMLEASLFQPLLRCRRLDIFPRKDMAPDKYFDLIPLTWTSCNNRVRTFTSTQFIFEMMIISFLDFQADEFMEAVAGKSFQGQIPSLRRLIDDIIDGEENGRTSKMPKKRRRLSGGLGKGLNGRLIGEDCLEPNIHLKCNRGQHEVQEPLKRFVRYISQHNAVMSASLWDRRSVLRELRIYLHAHATQSEDNTSLAKIRSIATPTKNGCNGRSQPTCVANYGSYFRWVRTTSGDHTACPYSFAFASCLVSAQLKGVEYIPTTRSKYLAAAACQHLATMCRMYNDYGSVGRDSAECNLNSVDFDEFECDNVDSGTDDSAVLEAKKETLFDLAQYERSCLEDAMRKLKQEMQECKASRQFEIFEMFCDVTDLYGQIYVVKDIASRMTK